ncbi:MAG: hypothetical protein ABI947_24705 [Chloroflexota bacterium]
MAYFISPLEESDLELQVETFVQQLGAHWPDLEILKPVPGDTYLVSWSLSIEGFRQLGGIQMGRQIVSIDDFPLGAAKFAVWYRTQIPSKHKLFIYHESSDQEFELLSTTTEEELLNMLNSD